MQKPRTIPVKAKCFVRRRWTLLCAALLLCLGSAPANAQDAGEIELQNARRTRQILDQVMSPYCQNRTLAECPAAAAEVERQKVRRWVDAGISEDDIKTRLEAELGPALQRNFSGDPSRPAYEPTISPIPKGAANRWVPVGILVAGAGLLGFFMLRLQSGGRAATGSGASASESSDAAARVSTKERRQIEAELDAELEARGIGGRPPRA